MSTAANYPVQRKKIHPHKFALWVAMGSISMMFAGLTSAYMVRQSQGNWRYYNLPIVFWISTAAILVSSVTIILAIKAFRARQMSKYKMLMVATVVLGIAFCALQWKGFVDLYQIKQAVRMNGEVLNDLQPVRMNGNPSESFLLIIAGLHIAHIIGGIVALLFVFFRSTRTRVKVYSSTGLEIAASYWHFVDVLWIYLFVFFLANQ
jgi:cytochrome c oxidase subunit III